MNTTDSAVRITHLPTGEVVAMQDEKSQIQNRAKALQVLRARLLKREQDRQAAELSEQRRGQIGGGGRSEKIRTYNYKENRVSDHRINLTTYNLNKVLMGELDEFVDALIADERARQLVGGGLTRRRRRGDRCWPRWRRSSGPASTPAASWSGRRATTAPSWSCTSTSRRPSGPASRATRMVARRRAGEPLQYAIGAWGFRRLDLYLDRRVLIPRPETEQVVEVALRRAAAARRCRAPLVVDLGTGSGAIALSIAVEVPGADVWATDVSADALAVARANLAGLGGRAATRVRLVEGSWFDALPEAFRGQVHLLVSNPPYVADGETLPAEVADWEPPGALRAGPHGARGDRRDRGRRVRVAGAARGARARDRAPSGRRAPSRSPRAPASTTSRSAPTSTDVLARLSVGFEPCRSWTRGATRRRPRR